MMDIMNVTCAEIRTEDGFEFRVSSDRFTQFSEFECEQLWYSKDDCLMADPSNPHRLIDPVISASSDRLVTSYCVDEVRHEIHCYTSGLRMETLFRVRNETAATPNSDVLDEVTPSLQLSDKLWWLFALFILIFIIFICFMLRKGIFRCFQREERFIRQREDDPENRDLVKVVSDDPRSLQESEMVRCPDDDHHLML